MGKYNAAVITTAGENIIAQAVQGTQLTWTKMRSSSTAIAAGTNLKSLTSLSGVQQTVDITSATVYNNSIVQVTGRFANEGISSPYYIRTVGIYGQLAGGSETLIAVMTAVTADEVPAYDADSPSAFIFVVSLAVQDAASVTMTVNPTGTATVADLNAKVDASGGDVADTVVASATASSAAYPIPAAGDSVKVILGKIRKFFTDIKAAVVGLSISGKTITYTKADGTTGTLTTRDTTYSAATQSANGLMTAADKKKLDGIASGAQVNSVTGVKGNAETNYRTGDVNITPANIGAAAASHNHSASNITSGTLPIERGGTGATTAAGIRNNLGLGNTTGALPVANGGTGATTADAARANLGLNGTIISTSARKTVASGTATAIASISLSQPGLYIIMSRAQFDSNANGYRLVHPRAGSTDYAGQTVRAVSGAVTEISSFDFLSIPRATTLSVVVEQDSNSSLGVTGWVGAYRLRAQ